MRNLFRYLIPSILLALASVNPSQASVVAEGDSPNTFGSDNAFRIFNDTTANITSATLTLTSGNSVWDSNLPSQPGVSFLLSPSSDPTGISHAFQNPEIGNLADFAGYYSLALFFTDFDAGETVIFGADIDGLFTNTGALAGNLIIDIVFGDGSNASAVYQLVNGDLIRAEAEAVPEPGTLALVCLVLALLVARRQTPRGAISG